MPLWQLVLDAIGILLLLALVYGVALLVRRRALRNRGATLEVSYRAGSGRSGRGWLFGLGRYSGERLEWFRIFTLSPWPKRSWDRSELEYAGRRRPEGAEEIALYPNHLVVLCETTGEPVELAMSMESLVGFQSWLEAMPPGSRSVRPGDNPTAL